MHEQLGSCMSSPRVIELHLSLGVVSRSNGASAVAKAAYNHRQRFRDERTGTVHNFRRRNADVTKFLRGYHGTSAQLWNDVEASETQLAFKQDRAQTAYNFNVAMPRELGRSDSIKAFVALCNWLHATFQVVVDGVVHWDETNPHAHVMFTQRVYDAKTRTWSRKKMRAFVAQGGGDGLQRLRAEAARIFNEALAVVSNARVEHTTLASRGIIRAPTQHEGPRAHYVRTRLKVSTDIHQRNLAASSTASPRPAHKKLSMKTQTPTHKPQDDQIQVRDFWHECARNLADAVRHPKAEEELSLSDYTVFRDRAEGTIAVAICKNADHEKHLAILQIEGSTHKAAAASLAAAHVGRNPQLVSVLAIPSASPLHDMKQARQSQQR